MTALSAGMQVMHNGRAVQLLFLIGEHADESLWWVKPLFVEGPEREELFTPGDPVRAIHMRYGAC